jgi:hypothetical protein
MAEEYIEQLIMRCDCPDHVETPRFTGADVDAEFEYKGVVKLMQITNHETNATHNERQYVLKIMSIDELEKM